MLWLFFMRSACMAAAVPFYIRLVSRVQLAHIIGSTSHGHKAPFFGVCIQHACAKVVSILMHAQAKLQ